MAAPALITALGSSFAAGPGIEPIVDAGAMRSGNNYAHQLALRLGARLVDRTVSGATTANILDTPQQLLDGTLHPPQLAGLPVETDVVTITAGGNDLQFAGSMLYAAWCRSNPDAPMTSMFRQMFPAGIARATDDAVALAARGLVDVVDRVRDLAPGARVFLVDYLTVLDEAAGSATPFSGPELAQLLDLQRAVGRVFTDAAAQTGVELVLASSLSAGHALGSAEPWVQPFHRSPARTGASFHPNAAGMAAVATELARILD